MKPKPPNDRRVAIACGGTGGHLYPGLAVAERLYERETEVTLLVSSKEVDRRALEQERRYRFVVLPAVGFRHTMSARLAALRHCVQSTRQARRELKAYPVCTLLSLGGFTSAPAAIAAWSLHVPVVLHEANAIPGKANRSLRILATRAFVYFPECAARLRVRDVRPLGLPVRQQFQPADAGACRMALGLDPKRLTLLVMGGSQGASGINQAMRQAVLPLKLRVPGLQILHLTGDRDETEIRAAYRSAGVTAIVRPFLTEMELALGAADAAVGRAGASSIAEIAAMRVPALLVPYPHAADDHQLANARALERARAADVILEPALTPELLAATLARLLQDEGLRSERRSALSEWHVPDADAALAEQLLALCRKQSARDGRSPSTAATAATAGRPSTA